MSTRPNTPPAPLIRRTPWPEGADRALGTPLQPSVVYVSDGPDHLDAQYDGDAGGYTYAREGHPNATVLAAKIDGLEGAVEGLIVGSGMAAVTAVMLGLCKAGDHVIGGTQLYGKSLKMLTQDLPRLGITTTLVDMADAANVAAAIRPETKLILAEVVANPTIRVSDIEGIAAVAAGAGVMFVIDNTFTTPRGFRALDHGADIVLHSVTKLLSGHADTTLGYVAAKNPEVRSKLDLASATFGLTPAPFDCWLAERGVYTFALRYDQAEQNAKVLADHLAGLSGVKRVLYPGRSDHPDADRVARLMPDRPGNMVSFEIEGGRAQASALVAAMSDVPFAPTLGDVATTLSHPCSSSHRGLSAQARADIGITEGFFRVSVGIETPEVLLESFSKGVAAIRG